MNKIKTTRSLLSALIVAAALGLVACGGGDSGSDAASILSSGTVGTVGDGVNASEYAAIQCGMNKDQVLAIIGDAPTGISFNSYTWNYQPKYFVGVTFFEAGNARAGLLIVKNMGVSTTNDKTNC